MTEIQLRRTFDLIGRFVAKKMGITIQFRPDVTPMCDPKAKVIFLPNNVDVTKIFPALAGLIHEAGHLKHTTFDPLKLVKDREEHSILNACEDIRIDNKNFRILPNIDGIHETLMAECGKQDCTKLPLSTRCLRQIIYEMESFGHLIKDDEAGDFIDKHGLESHAYQLISYLDMIERGQNRYVDARKKILDIKAILHKADKQSGQGKGQPQPGTGQGGQQGAPGDGSSGQAQGAGKNDKGSGKKDKDKDGNDKGGGKGDQGQDNGPSINNPGNSGFGKGIWKIDKNAQSIPSVIGGEALSEITKNHFIDILKSKENRTVSFGRKLDTRRLISYGLGDVDDLFTEHTIKRPLRSKVMILLDASGSMDERLMDGKWKSQTLAEIGKDITNLLDELHEANGIDIDYEVRGFDMDYYRWSKETWDKDYLKHCKGGTNLLRNFDKAQQELLDDYTVNGKKLIMIITDGEVSNSEIDSVKTSILGKNEDVRCMFIGMGSNPTGHFVREVSGHNILAKEMADVVLLDAIMEML